MSWADEMDRAGIGDPDQTPQTEAFTDNFGLPVTNAGQVEHSRQHLYEGTEHTIIGYCPVAQRVKRIEAQARTEALTVTAMDVKNAVMTVATKPDIMRVGPLVSRLDVLNIIDATYRAILAGEPEP